MKSVIFDLDGLLIDSETVSYHIYQDMLRKYGYEFTIEDYAQNYSGKTSVHNMTALVNHFHLPVSVEEGLKLTDDMEEEYIKSGIDLKNGAKELLSYLQEHHYVISLASSSTEERAMTILRQHNIQSYFDSFTFGYEVREGKPNPDIFLKACEKTKCLKKETLILEDSEAGIQAAFSAGIPVICIPDMKMPERNILDKAIAVKESLIEVIDWLEKRVG